jgi:hypothetical protein
LEKRLNEGRSPYTNRPLSERWTVQEVKTEGPFLLGTARLIEQPGGKTINFAVMVITSDYLFLYPN